MHCPYCKAGIESLQTKPLEERPDAEKLSYYFSGKKLNTDTEACSACGQTMYIKRHPATGEVHLLNKEDAYSLDSVRLVNLYARVSEDVYAKFLSSSADDNRSAEKLIWSVLDRKRIAAKKRGDWNIVSKILFQKARYYCSIGKGFFSIHQDAFRYQLMDLLEKGATHVRVVAGHDRMACQKCADQEGMVFTIEEVLEKMPLPVQCDNGSRKSVIDNDPGWCRCYYIRRDIKDRYSAFFE